MADSLELNIIQADGALSSVVQGIWCAKYFDGVQTLKKSLYTDAGTGVLFNFGNVAHYGEAYLEKGVYFLPCKKEASYFSLPPGTFMAGIRFRPGVNFRLFNPLRSQTLPVISLPTSNSPSLTQVQKKLAQSHNTNEALQLLKYWLNQYINQIKVPPKAVLNTLHHIDNTNKRNTLIHKHPLSQRQIERLFSQWIGITPKYYQRISRLNSALQALKHHPEKPLADIALQCGFADQAHMTREFKKIAHNTPKSIQENYKPK